MTSDVPPVSDTGLSLTAISKHLARVQTSPRFNQAPRLCQLLDYLVENSVHGDSRNLSEFAVGLGVFGRGEDFDPQTDTIVRVTVCRLRRFLAEYYSNEGARDSVQFQIPTGHYRVEISTPLSDSETAKHSWVRRCENRIPFPMAAFAIFALFLLTLFAGFSTVPAGPGVEPDPQAKTHVLLGQHLLHRRGPGDLKKAIHEFELAVSKDAYSVEAWIGLAWALSISSAGVTAESGNLVSRPFEALHKALELDPDNPEANAVMSRLLAKQRDLARSSLYMKRAIKSGADNNLVLSMVAGAERAGGNLEQALVLQRRANSLPPLDGASYNNLAYMLYESGHFDDALEAFYQTEKISPAEPKVKALIVKTLIMKGEFQLAEQKLEQIPPGANKQQAAALLNYATGREKESLRALQDLADHPMSPDIGTKLAEVFAFRQEYDQATDEIETTYQQILNNDSRLSWQCSQIQTLLNSPYLANLADHPRFKVWAHAARAHIASTKPKLLTLAALERNTTFQ